jgi:hypothetical protein
VTFNSEQSTISTSSIPATIATPDTTAPTFGDNPVIDHLGENFEQPPLDQGCPKHIPTEPAAIKCLHTGEGVMSHLPKERGKLLKGIQEADKNAQMAELDNEWEIVNVSNVMSGMAAAMAEADAYHSWTGHSGRKPSKSSWII